MIMTKLEKYTLTQKELQDLLYYNQKTGLFYWKAPNKYKEKIKKGTLAGFIHTDRYRRIKIKGRSYLAHRLAWLWMTGKWPKNDIDHIDRNRTDNSWRNLREATRSQNKINVGTHINNTSGHQGVIWHKRDKKWYARITINYKRKSLGYYDSKKEAIIAYEKAAIKYFGKYYNAKLI